MRAFTVRAPGRDDDVLGEFPLAPSALTGLSESQLARAVAGSLPQSDPLRIPAYGVFSARSDRLESVAAWARR